MKIRVNISTIEGWQETQILSCEKEEVDVLLEKVLGLSTRYVFGFVEYLYKVCVPTKNRIYCFEFYAQSRDEAIQRSEIFVDHVVLDQASTVLDEPTICLA